MTPKYTRKQAIEEMDKEALESGMGKMYAHGRVWIEFEAVKQVLLATKKEKQVKDGECKVKDVEGVHTIPPSRGGGELRFKLWSACANCDRRLKDGEVICSVCNPTPKPSEPKVEPIKGSDWKFRYNGTGEWQDCGVTTTELKNKINELISDRDRLWEAVNDLLNSEK